MRLKINKKGRGISVFVSRLEKHGWYRLAPDIFKELEQALHRFF